MMDGSLIEVQIKTDMDQKKETTEEMTEEQKRSKDPLYCDLCSVQCASAQALVNHCRSFVHTERAMEDDAQRKQNQANKPNPPKEKPKKTAPPPVIRYCEVCECDCPGDGAYEIHLVGTRHQKNLVHRQNGEPIAQPGKKSKKGCASVDDTNAMPVNDVKIQKTLDSCKNPLIGLKYLTEYQDEDPLVEMQYVCAVCENTMNSSSVLPHLMGIKHRLAYLKEHHWVYYKSIKQKDCKRSETIPIVEEYARVVETEEGRQKPKAKFNLNKVYQERRAEKKRQREAQKNEQRVQMQAKRGRMDYGGVGRGSNMGRGGWDRGSGWESVGGNNWGTSSGPHGPGGRGGRGGQGGGYGWNNQNDGYNSRGSRYNRDIRPFKELLADISASEITNEEDASLALQVSNSLTQKILEYRITNVPSDKEHVVSEIMGDSWRGQVQRGQGNRGQRGGYSGSRQGDYGHGARGSSMLEAGGYQKPNYDPWQLMQGNGHSSQNTGFHSFATDDFTADNW